MFKIRFSIVTLTWLTFFSAPTAIAASFNCEKAVTDDEIAICNTEKLSELDVRMAKLYRDTREQVRDKDSLKKEQIVWLSKRRECKGNVKCIEALFLGRISELSQQYLEEQNSARAKREADDSEHAREALKAEQDAEIAQQRPAEKSDRSSFRQNNETESAVASAVTQESEAKQAMRENNSIFNLENSKAIVCEKDHDTGTETYLVLLAKDDEYRIRELDDDASGLKIGFEEERVAAVGFYFESYKDLDAKVDPEFSVYPSYVITRDREYVLRSLRTFVYTRFYPRGLTINRIEGEASLDWVSFETLYPRCEAANDAKTMDRANAAYHEIQSYLKREYESKKTEYEKGKANRL